jgi:gluconate 2-dehydrogenase alpha chain
MAAKHLPKKDVVIIGLGWSGSLIAEQLTAEGLEVLALERGPSRDTATDFPTSWDPDELRYAIRQELFLQAAQQTVTFRNRLDQTALPIRRFGSFLPGNGVGGAGVHWNGHTWRFLPSDFELRSHLVGRYGADRIPADMTIQDWGVSYRELEPYYDRFEYLAGISGRAGRIGDKVQAGGNPFEGPRSRDYPLPPLRDSPSGTLFAETVRNLGYSPFPRPAANASAPYTNPLGVTLGECTYCGFCERFGCGNYAKGSPQSTILPALLRRRNFTLRAQCEVLHIDKDRAGTRATGVTFVDAAGQEWHQPADLVICCAFILDNVRLLLISGIGKPYDPATGEGVVGRNYAYQSGAGARLFFEGKRFNPFIGTGSLGQCIDDFNGDNFDHAPLDFVGGGHISVSSSNGRPIAASAVAPPGTPRWGAAWKRQLGETYQNTTVVAGQGSVYAYRESYLDLDPRYTDRFGRPLMRMTFDWHDNERRMTDFLASRCVEIGQAMGAKQVVPGRMAAHHSVVPYQTTHNTGGAVMGSDPKTSAVNRYLQSWDLPNLFVVGASAFPQNAGYNPTGTVGALSLWAAHAIRSRYLKNPGPLA